VKKSNQTFLWGFIIAVVAVVLLGFNTFKGFLIGSGPNVTTRALAMSCTTDMATRFHIHLYLAIRINGVPQEIPENIGVSLTCMHPIHTHGSIGEIHVESPEQRDFTLGDFFAVWGKTFSKDQILDSFLVRLSSNADATHEIIMTIDGAPNQDFERLILRDKQQIVIEYRKVAGTVSR